MGNPANSKKTQRSEGVDKWISGEVKRWRIEEVKKQPCIYGSEEESKRRSVEVKKQISKEV